MAFKSAAFAGNAAPSATGSQGAILNKVFAAVSSACGKLNREIAVRSAISELGQLDDRALQDIGIRRCDIERFARHGAGDRNNLAL